MVRFEHHDPIKIKIRNFLLTRARNCINKQTMIVKNKNNISGIRRQSKQKTNVESCKNYQI